MNGAAHVLLSAHPIIAMVRRRTEMRGRVVRARSLTATTARAIRRSRAMSVDVKVRRLGMTGAVSDFAD